jgi:hypothetical protein
VSRLYAGVVSSGLCAGLNVMIPTCRCAVGDRDSRVLRESRAPSHPPVTVQPLISAHLHSA